MRREQTLIVVPVYNEAATLDRVLDAVRRASPTGDVLVVDDGSSDRTPQILQRRHDIRVLRHDANQGYGQSLITGFAHALAAGYDLVVTIDCDEQHEPHRIPEFLGALAGADIVSGSRYLDPQASGDLVPADRRQLNQEFTDLLRAITGLALTDAWCGFKAYRAAALRQFRLSEPSYGMPLQVWIQAAYHELRVVELPVARIYKNPRRKFWGGLDDVQTRRTYYLRVLRDEVARWFPDRLHRVPAQESPVIAPAGRRGSRERQPQ